MTDGLYFNDEPLRGPGSTCPETQLQINTEQPQIDLSTFAQWIELQPTISTHAGLLELIGNDLYRRHYPTIAAECKGVVRDLRALAKYSA